DTDWDSKAASPSRPADAPTADAVTGRAPSLGHIVRPSGDDPVESSPGLPASATGPIVTGPPPSPALTVGQALLTSGTIHPSGSTVSAGTSPRSTRAILIIIPRVPPPFRL